MQLLGWVPEAYAGDKTAEIKTRLQKLKLLPAALSCSNVRLSPDSTEDFKAQFREYAAFLVRSKNRSVSKKQPQNAISILPTY